MRQSRILLLVLIALSVVVSWFVLSPTFDVVEAAEQTKLAPNLLREDFQVLRRALEEGDSGIYRYTPKAEMDRIFDTAYDRIDHPMDTLEFFRFMAPVVAAMKCGHTRMRLPVELQKEIAAQVPLFPAEVVVLGQKAYIPRNIGKSDNRLTGAEILKINGVPTNQILKTMMAVVHGDGNTATSGPWRLSHDQTFVTSLYTLVNVKAPFQLEYRPLNGRKVENVELQGKTLNEIRETLRQNFPSKPDDTSAASLRFLDDGNIAVLKIDRFDARMNGKGSEQTKDFFKQAFEQIHGRNSAALILDVRNNWGGQDDLGKLLLSYLTTEPFKYYDDLVVNPTAVKYISQSDLNDPENRLEKWSDGKLHDVGHPNWGIQQPSQPVFTGKVFALMNGGSFSTTCEFLSNLHFRHRATFIGEEVAGAYYGNTSGMSAPVVLPNSRLVLGLWTLTYYLAVSGNPHPDHGVMPDYPVAYSIQDLLAGTDKDMDLALGMARRPQK